MLEIEEKGWFKRHIFRNCLMAGIFAGGMTGWLIGRSAGDILFTTIIGVFGGFFVGFLVAMFMRE